MTNCIKSIIFDVTKILYTLSSSTIWWVDGCRYCICIRIRTYVCTIRSIYLCRSLWSLCTSICTDPSDWKCYGSNIVTRNSSLRGLCISVMNHHMLQKKCLKVNQMYYVVLPVGGRGISYSYIYMYVYMYVLYCTEYTIVCTAYGCILLKKERTFLGHVYVYSIYNILKWDKIYNHTKPQ